MLANDRKSARLAPALFMLTLGLCCAAVLVATHAGSAHLFWAGFLIGVALVAGGAAAAVGAWTLRRGRASS